ncbi:putative ribonuclease H-like domain-containing protein [Tanacetum coccineum]
MVLGTWNLRCHTGLRGIGFTCSILAQGLFLPPTIDLSYSGLEEFQQHEFQGYGSKASKSVCVDTSAGVKQTPETSLVVELVLEKEKQTVFPTKIKFVKQQDKTARKPLSSDFVMYNKACFVCGSFDHAEANCKYHQRERMVYGNNYNRVNYKYTTNMTHPNAQRNMVPRVVLMKTGLKSFNTAKIVNTAHPKSIVAKTVNTARAVNTARPKAVNTARPHSAVVNAVRTNQANVVKASSCWVWRPTKLDSASITLKKHNYINARGRSKSLMEDFLPLVEESEEARSLVKATLDESMLWHRRLGHINFKTINKLVKDNLMRGLPSKRSENNQTCVACLMGKQPKASSDLLRCDNGIEFKNRVMNKFCKQKGIKREYNVARTPQQNGVAERINKTLIENRVIIVKPHNKTPYELFRGRTPALSFMRPFGCHVSILNTLDHLGKFDRKSDDGFFVGYSLTSKAFRVYNIRTRRVEENLHIRFLEDKPIVLGDGPKWLFDLNSLTKSMNYVPVAAGTNSNDFAGLEVSISEGSTSKEADTSQEYIVMTLWKDSSLFDSPHMNVSHDKPEVTSDAEKRDDEGVSKISEVDNQERPKSSTPNINTVGPSINTASPNPRTGTLHIKTVSPTVITTRSNHPQTVSNIFSKRDNVTLEATNADLFGDETEMDMSNLNASYQVHTTPNTIIHKDYSLNHVIGDIQSGEEPKRVTKALSDPSWVEAMQEELLQNKKDERGIVIENKARLVAQGYTQEKGIDYDEVFAPVARIEAIRLFLAYASFMGFMVYQMDVKSAFLYGQIEEEVYVCQPLSFEDPDNPDKVYKVVKALYGLHQAPRAWYETLAKYLLDNGFHRGKIDQTLFIKKQKGDMLLMSSMGELTFFLGLQVKQKEDGIFISQDKYVTDILKKSMIGSLMYLTSSRPDIMFVVYAYARFQVTPKVSHSHAVKRIIRYLKGKPKLGLWYPKDSPFDLVAHFDSDYAGASLDRKSTTGGCQFLGYRLISWQCKKQTVVATSSTKAEYVAAANLLIKALDVGRIGTVGDEAIHKELGDIMERDATIASSLEGEQDSDNINRTQSMATLNESNP